MSVRCQNKIGPIGAVKEFVSLVSLFWLFLPDTSDLAEQSDLSKSLYVTLRLRLNRNINIEATNSICALIEFLSLRHPFLSS